MLEKCGCKKYSTWTPLVVILYFIINFRVEAGIATMLERALDGLVAVMVLVSLLYIGACFFKIVTPFSRKK